MKNTPRTRLGWREAGLILLIIAPLLYLLSMVAPIPQDPRYHVFADSRPCLGLPNCSNMISNLAFFIVGTAGVLWCRSNPGAGAISSWAIFFLGVTLVFIGSGFYHYAPANDSLMWDRLPMTIAFMGLFAALLSEHLDRKREWQLLLPALAVGLASVVWWRLTDDLRIYLWVQITPLLVIAYVITVFPGRHTHRHYLLYGVACYTLAKVAENYDNNIYMLTAGAISGHTVKHLVAAIATLWVLLMLRRRTPDRTQSLTPVASSQ